MELLRGRPQFWQALAAGVPTGPQRQLDLEESQDPVEGWTGRSDAAWAHAGEAAALQIIALEAYRHPRPAPGAS